MMHHFETHLRMKALEKITDKKPNYEENNGQFNFTMVGIGILVVILEKLIL